MIEEVKKPIVLMVLDGFGLSWKKKGNAIKLANTPVLDKLTKTCPYAVLKASGESVGLPKGFMGNSEVGHINIGAGRVVDQYLMRINNSIKDGSFFEIPTLIEAFDKNEYVHLMGLLSDGGVHSHIYHLFALIDLAKKYNCKVYVHAFLDGRDTKPKCAKKYIKRLQKKLKGVGIIATISGRYYSMDRDNRWDRTQKAYDTITKASGLYNKNIYAALKQSYKKKIGDEFIIPLVTGDYHGLKEKDTVIFFNFREDRARQLTQAFIDPNFDKFKRTYKDVNLIAFSQYDDDFKNFKVIFPPVYPKNTLGEVLSSNDIKQLRIAESEKYAHVTYFFNGLRETPFEKETRIVIPSPKVATYDQQPEMNADKVTEKVLENLKKNDVIIINFANGDMVGHTGILKAAIKAVEKVDVCVGKIIEKVKELNGVVIITADHGNCEEMIVGYNETDTAHSTNPVFFMIYNQNIKIRSKGILADIAPTILDLLNIEKPKEMTGESMIVKYLL
tara:strand:+ start:4194 stop:5699 length:1506 start_codon:yes stop_codon:yes gene_type:complete